MVEGQLEFGDELGVRLLEDENLVKFVWKIQYGSRRRISLLNSASCRSRRDLQESGLRSEIR